MLLGFLVFFIFLNNVVELQVTKYLTGEFYVALIENIIEYLILFLENAI